MYEQLFKMKIHPNRTLHIAVVGLKLNFQYFYGYVRAERLHCLPLFEKMFEHSHSPESAAEFAQ